MSSFGLFVKSFHKNLQRGASLAVCVSAAHASRTTSVQSLAQRYSELVARHVPVPNEEVERVVRYLADRALITKYAKGGSAETLRESLAAGRTLELQDLLLSSSDLPSSSGAEREQSYGKTVAVCQELQLLKERALTVQPAGQLLLEVAKARGLLPVQETPNPFRRDLGLAMAVSLLVFRADLGFSSRLMAAIPATEFSVQDMFGALPSVLESLHRSIPNAPASRAEREWVARQLTAATKFQTRLAQGGWGDSKGGVAIQTLQRPLEDLLLTRLEFMVDLGVLTKPDARRYVYRPAAAASALLRPLQSVDALASSYFSAVYAVNSLASDSLQNGDAIVAHLRPAYRLFRSVSGYAPIFESVCYANASSVGSGFLELADAVDALKSLATAPAPIVRVTADRLRRPHSFKLTDEH